MQQGLALVVAATVACGGSSAPPTKAPENTTGTAGAGMQSREQIVNATILAITAGDVEKLMSLADPKGMFEYAISCKEGRGDDELDATHVAAKQRADFTKAIEKARGTKVEVVSIRNEARAWTGRRSRYSTNDRNATFVSKGGTVAKSCAARTDLMFHEVEVKVRLAKGSDTKESKLKFDLVHGGGRWFLVKIPTDIGSPTGMSGAMAKMEEFQIRMCNCKDKACADQVNEDMTKWGTEMARSATYDPDDRPDPDMAKKSADIMTKYTECMTKLMMAAVPGPGSDAKKDEPAAGSGSDAKKDEPAAAGSGSDAKPAAAGSDAKKEEPKKEEPKKEEAKKPDDKKAGGW
jgi:hypothetical protein